ncbi:MAG: hypothetical protein JXA94_07000 [Parachlamydiales bacterium]|nr:hypothetical protein [Parachlamydiales bacterium]
MTTVFRFLSDSPEKILKDIAVKSINDKNIYKRDKTLDDNIVSTVKKIEKWIVSLIALPVGASILTAVSTFGIPFLTINNQSYNNGLNIFGLTFKTTALPFVASLLSITPSAYLAKKLFSKINDVNEKYSSVYKANFFTQMRLKFSAWMQGLSTLEYRVINQIYVK